MVWLKGQKSAQDLVTFRQQSVVSSSQWIYDNLAFCIGRRFVQHTRPIKKQFDDYIYEVKRILDHKTVRNQMLETLKGKDK